MLNRHYYATCVTSPRGSRDGLRYRNGKLRKLSRNATPEPPFSSAERATVDSADYTSGQDAAKRAGQAEFLRGPASSDPARLNLALVIVYTDEFFKLMTYRFEGFFEQRHPEGI